jgi:hypothetical protein
MISVVDLHAPDRYVRDAADVDDVASADLRVAASALLVDQALALEPEDVVVGRERQAVRGGTGLLAVTEALRRQPARVAEADDQLVGIHGQPM